MDEISWASRVRHSRARVRETGQRHALRGEWCSGARRWFYYCVPAGSASDQRIQAQRDARRVLARVTGHG